LYQCALDIIQAGHDDFPCSSNFLSVARMAALIGRQEEAIAYFDLARGHLDASGQRPLRGIVDLDEARVLARGTYGDQHKAHRLAIAAHQRFVDLGMTGWALTAAALRDDLAVRMQESNAVPGGLTQRELDVVRLVVRGYSDRQIGDDIFVSPRTVNAHIRNILAKTQLKNRTELSMWAMEHGVVRADSNESASSE
jgi:DNA-binding CsgD family transcriptional regulator